MVGMRFDYALMAIVQQTASASDIHEVNGQLASYKLECRALDQVELVYSLCPSVELAAKIEGLQKKIQFRELVLRKYIAAARLGFPVAMKHLLVAEKK